MQRAEAFIATTIISSSLRITRLLECQVAQKQLFILELQHFPVGCQTVGSPADDWFVKAAQLVRQVFEGAKRYCAGHGEDTLRTSRQINTDADALSIPAVVSHLSIRG